MMEGADNVNLKKGILRYPAYAFKVEKKNVYGVAMKNLGVVNVVVWHLRALAHIGIPRAQE